MARGYGYLIPNKPRKQFTLRGQIQGVLPKDHPQNPTDHITLYQVLLYEGNGYLGHHHLPFVYAPGGCDQDARSGSETPYHHGDNVLIGFLYGDPMHPYIIGRDLSGLDSDCYMTQEEWPRHYLRRNHLVEIVDRSGRKHETMVERGYTAKYDHNRTMRIKYANEGAVEVYNAQGGIQARYKADGSSEILDANGDVRVVVKANGDVELGGNGAALHKLIDERAAAIFNSHTHTVIAVPAQNAAAVSITSSGPSDSITSAHMTDKTKGS